jgi:hypothetical protein
MMFFWFMFSFPFPQTINPFTTLTGPQKDISQNPLPITTNGGYFSNAKQSTMNISSNSLFQPSSTILSSSLPSAAAPIHHIPQLLLSKIFCALKKIHTLINHFLLLIIFSLN